MKVGGAIGCKYPVLVVKLRYLARFGRLPNLRNPKDLNEKILYLKLFSDTSRWTELADKYRVREYVAACGLEHCLIPMYGAWERVEDIPFDDLPDSIMLKANNGDGKCTNMIVHKAELTGIKLKQLKLTLQRWLNQRNIGALSAEPQYRGIRPMIIAEELLPVDEGCSSLIDYKIWCFNGQPHSFLVCSGRKGHQVSLGCYDLEWNYYPERMVVSDKFGTEEKPLPKPACLEEMIEIARRLSEPFPEVRVDLYQTGGKVYFGELTFTSLGGMMNYYTPEYLMEMGALMKL